jgi:hypothetical protein
VSSANYFFFGVVTGGLTAALIVTLVAVFVPAASV